MNKVDFQISQNFIEFDCIRILELFDIHNTDSFELDKINKFFHQPILYFWTWEYTMLSVKALFDFFFFFSRRRQKNKLNFPSHNTRIWIFGIFDSIAMLEFPEIHKHRHSPSLFLNRIAKLTLFSFSVSCDSIVSYFVNLSLLFGQLISLIYYESIILQLFRRLSFHSNVFQNNRLIDWNSLHRDQDRSVESIDHRFMIIVVRRSCRSATTKQNELMPRNWLVCVCVFFISHFLLFCIVLQEIWTHWITCKYDDWNSYKLQSHA